MSASAVHCRNAKCVPNGKPTKIGSLRRVVLLRKLTTAEGVKVTAREDGGLELTCPVCGWVTHFSWSKREPR